MKEIRDTSKVYDDMLDTLNDTKVSQNNLIFFLEN